MRQEYNGIWTLTLQFEVSLLLFSHHYAMCVQLKCVACVKC